MNIELQNTIINFLSPHTSKIAIFGSYARGEETKESDIDLMVQPKGDMDLLTFAGLKEDLTDKIGIKVDLLTFNTIKNVRLKKYIDKDLTVIFDEQG